jgi:RecJ-like exonuclease
MARREEVSFNLKCPKCGKKGTITWTENENPVYSGLERDFGAVSDGFKRSKKHDRDDHFGVICAKCKTEVSY